MRPPVWPDVPCLAAYPYVIVRVACSHCPNRTGSYRLARLAARLGPETSLEEHASACSARPQRAFHISMSAAPVLATHRLGRMATSAGYLWGAGGFPLMQADGVMPEHAAHHRPHEQEELPLWQTFAHTTRLADPMAGQHPAEAAQRVVAGQRIRRDRHCAMRRIKLLTPGTAPRSTARGTTVREAEQSAMWIQPR